MKLKDILKDISVKQVKGDLDLEVKDICQKIEKIKKGSLFFCIKGISHDGHNFYKEAIKKGATVLIVEKFLDCSATQVLVANVRNVILKICNNFFNNIANKFKFIGVSGTNGKTTTSNIVYQILKNSSKKVGLIGTNGIVFNNFNLSNNLTTPDTVDLFYILNKMLKSKIEYVVMEVSAHALDLNKLLGIKFEVGIFTNLTQDHLDYFKTMKSYALAKLKFFKKRYCKNIVVNIDDEYGRLFLKLTNTKYYTYGLNNPSDCFAIDINLKIDKTKFVANIFDNIFVFNTGLICLFNVYNILAAATCCKILGIQNKFILQTINQIETINGRMNFFKLKNGAYIVVDYAHTPDGLQKVLQNLKFLKQKHKKLICVFGCGGNRDKVKRHIMGEVAFSLSDTLIVTNDNPRDEDENKIIEDICKNINGNILKNPNRKGAIKMAYDESDNGDIILVAGKGCELTQEIRGQKIAYSDLKEVKKYI